MSCPDWRALSAAREADPAAELPAWEEARRHAAHCARCRQTALAAEPLLLFARLPERRVSAGEIGEMQTAVAALVRAGRVAQGSSSAPTRHRSVGRLSVTRAAAALVVCSLVALSGAPRSRPSGGALLAGGDFGPAQGGLPPVGSVVEELDRPGARIYELPQADMAVVMIVDASLDV